MIFIERFVNKTQLYNVLTIIQNYIHSFNKLTITQFNKFSSKCDWSFSVDFIMLNTNLIELAYHVRILRKLKLNVPKRAIFTTRFYG